MKSGDWPKSRLAIVALLIASPLICFFPLIHADFTNWDDPETIVNNSDMSAPIGEALAKFWSDFRKPEGDIYIPLTRSLWRVLSSFARTESPQGLSVQNSHVFHAANVVAHIGSILLVYLLLRFLVRHDVAACLGALLFGLHPTQVEAVAWASGLKDVLSGLLSLAALCA